MAIGIALPSGEIGSGNLVDTLIEHVHQAAAAGLDSVWFSQLFTFDALSMAAVAGHAVPDIAIGTSVVPIYARHPITLSSQAQTAQAASHGRFTLGLGLSGKALVEGVYGIPYERPIRHLREQLVALRSLLDEGRADVRGDTLVARTQDRPAFVPGARPPVPIVVAAMGSQALRVTGELADGTLPYLAGPKTLAGHIVPAITAAARAAGRRAPRVIAGLLAVVTSDVDQVRARAYAQQAFYSSIPSYRAVLDREGVAHPGELAVIGDEDTVAAGIERYLAAGATEVVVTQTGLSTDADRLRTWRLLGELARSRR